MITEDSAVWGDKSEDSFTHVKSDLSINYL